MKDNLDKNPYLALGGKKSYSREEVRKLLMPYMFHKDQRPLFYASVAMVVGAKTLNVASPYILKKIVDSMTLATVDFYSAGMLIGLFGATRVLATVCQEVRMVYVAKFIAEGLRKVGHVSFEHLHKLDLNFHKTSSKNTVFAINRAIRSIEAALRFGIGFAGPIVLEFALLCGML